MKKLLMILAAGCFTLPALSQSSVIGDSKPMRDTKTANLDGKTFKITFGEQTITQGTPPTERWKENANDASIKKDMNSDNTIDHGVNKNTTITDDKTRQGMHNETMTDDQRRMQNETMTDEQRRMQNNTNTENRTAQDMNNRNANNTTMDNQSGAMTSADFSSYEQSMKGKTAEITFTENEMQSTMLSDNNYKTCPYSVSASSDNMKSFYSNCRNDARVNSQFAGIVEGRNISGTMTYATPGGKMIKYDFKGTAVTTKKKKTTETSEVKE